MIVRINSTNQSACFDDDQRRLKSGKRLHYSIGTHVHVLINRVAQLEADIRVLQAAQGTSASGQDPKGLEAKPAGPVGNADAPVKD